MEPESQVLKVLRQVGIKRGQTILDFGCGCKVYPDRQNSWLQERMYILDKDKEALDKLMQKARYESLRNIEKTATTEGLEIKLTDDSVDVVFLFDVFHSFYFPYR
jgi:predicted TPR repeat methyltransferase